MIILLLLIQKSNYTVLLKWLIFFYCVCAFLYDLKCLQNGVSGALRMESPQQHPVPWMRPSITPPAFTASSGPVVAVVSSSSVTPEPVRASRERPKDTEDVILVKFIQLVSVQWSLTLRSFKSIIKKMSWSFYPKWFIVLLIQGPTIPWRKGHTGGCEPVTFCLPVQWFSPLQK